MAKKDPSNYHNKLKSYSFLAGTLITTVNAAKAQTVYTDIIPDSTVNTDGGTFNLDLNNDGTFDFTFFETHNPGGSSTSSYTKTGISPLGSNAIAGSVSGAYIYPFAMNSGDTVKASLTWNIGSNQSMGSYWGGVAPYGNWLGLNDKYVGLKLDVAGNIYYGWARLDVDATGSAFTIKDYAYMNSIDQEIVIGATSVGINNQQLEETTIYNDNREIYIRSESKSDGLITITNMAGQQVHVENKTGTETIINLEAVKAGIYFVTLSSGDLRYTKRILIN
jgi:hypothetical protein